MKKLSVICMTILAITFLASCRGPQGPAGHDGNANVASSTITIYPNNWEWVNDCQWMVEIDYPAITDNVYSHGAVLVYMDVEGAWSQVPLTYYYEDVLTYDDGTEETINCAASIEVATLNDSGVRLFWTESDFYDGYRPGTHDFKIVAIEATVYNSRSDVDFSSYEAVKKAFQLADD
ncbi:MAG: hypothetical protein IJK78_14415 [Bacteroidales bacterium]|nr:hypothetical protein [Bacteroidales bacterium]